MNSLWFVVPAAGVGSRMQSATPKQYLPLMGATILEVTLKHLLAVDMVAGIVVALHADDEVWSSLAISNHPLVHRVIGGETRSTSVLAGLRYLEGKLSASDWILVHDAARPCVQPSNVKKMIANLLETDVGGILAIPAGDTLKRVDEHHRIEQTIDRSTVWQAQTPQMFRYGILHQALNQAIKQQRVITDEASAVEAVGYSAQVVLGRQDNIKITRPDDLWLAEMILQYHQQANTDIST